MSSPFLSAAAWAAIPARRYASDAGTAKAGSGVKRRCPGASSAASVEAAAADARARRRGARGRRSGVPSPRRRRRSVEAMSRRGIDTRSTRQPGPGGSACTSPARSTTTTVARSAGLVEPAPGAHVGHRVGAEHQEQLPVAGRSSASSVSAVTDGASALDLDRGRLDPVDALDRGVDRARAASGADATTRPRFCHGSPATTRSTRSSPSCAAGLGGHDDVPDVHRVERASEHAQALAVAVPGHAAGVYGRTGRLHPSAKHSRHLHPYASVA